MIQRCTNPNSHAYELYGGRGIRVCERWLVFDNFLADMGERPAGLTLERVDNDGDYEPGNCRWATQVEQARNKRNSIDRAKVLALRADGLSARQIAKRLGHSQPGVSKVLREARCGYEHASST